MKKIYLIRHAKSSWSDFSLKDYERPLNKRGKRDAPFMGALLKKENIQPDLLMSSHAVRANTTAKKIAKAIDYDKNRIIIESEIYEAATQTILKIINNLDDDFESVMLFGHNPAFTYVANHFSDFMIENVPTCGIVFIESEVDKWEDFNETTAKVTRFEYPKKHGLL